MGTPRRIVERRSVAVAALALSLAAGCHLGGGSATESEPGPYTRADVETIVLGPSDAPKGTSYVDSVSGFQDLRAFARDDVELVHLQEDGFQVGHLALFFPSGRADGGAPEPLTSHSMIVQGITGLFRDADGAERSLERYVQDLRSRQLPGAREVPAAGLGDTAFGLRGKTPDGARVQMFVWRIGNLILAVSGGGPVDPAEVRALADLLDGRT
ncbi:MAG: hypothetical protein ACXWYT_09905 [Actinomycetota bacterium]